MAADHDHARRQLAAQRPAGRRRQVYARITPCGFEDLCCAGMYCEAGDCRARLDRAAAIYGAQEGIQDGELACIGTLARVMLAAEDREHARPLVERALADARAGGDRIQRSEIAELDRLLGTMTTRGEQRGATGR